MALGLRLALFLCVGSVLLSVASAAQADDPSPPRSVSVCTPTAWQHGCTSPLVDGLGEPLESWQLTRVVPLLWSIEAFDTSPRVAIETLELNYGGFISATTC
jgi:hypothetical protein